MVNKTLYSIKYLYVNKLTDSGQQPINKQLMTRNDEKLKKIIIKYQT